MNQTSQKPSNLVHEIHPDIWKSFKAVLRNAIHLGRSEWVLPDFVDLLHRNCIRRDQQIEIMIDLNWISRCYVVSKTNHRHCGIKINKRCPWMNDLRTLAERESDAA
jgi:hypothetical protein